MSPSSPLLEAQEAWQKMKWKECKSQGQWRAQRKEGLVRQHDRGTFELTDFAARYTEFALNFTSWGPWDERVDTCFHL